MKTMTKEQIKSLRKDAERYSMGTQWIALCDMALRSLEAPRSAIAPKLPEFIRKRLERECEEAENPKGMSVHDGRTRVHSSDIRYLLKLIDALAASPAESATRPIPEWVAAMQHYLNEYNALRKKTANTHILNDPIRDFQSEAWDHADEIMAALSAPQSAWRDLRPGESKVLPDFDSIAAPQSAPPEEREPIGEEIAVAFDRETWGAIIDGLVLECDRSESRNAANPQSLSRERMKDCNAAIAKINGVMRLPRMNKESKA